MNNFLGMLVGEKLNISTEVLHQIAEKNGILLQAEQYRILIVACTGEIADADQYQRYCIDLPAFCLRFFARHKQRVLVEHDYAGKSIVLLLDSPQRFQLAHMMEELAQLLERHQFTSTVVAIGKQVDLISETALSYHTALNALNYRSLYSGERILFCEDMQAMLQISTLQSIVDPNQILRLFQQGEMERLRAAVTAYAERVRSLSGDSIDGRHPTSIRRMFVELTVYVLHMAADMGINVDESLRGLDPYNFLLFEKQATPVIIDWFMDLCAQIRTDIDKRSKYQEHTVISTVCEYIHSHIAQCDLNLDEVAAKVNMTASYLSKLFHKEMGIGFSKFVVQARLKIASELLINTDHPVKEISERSGFASANYFGTVFKKEYGVSPLVYRVRSAERN